MHMHVIVQLQYHVTVNNSYRSISCPNNLELRLYVWNRRRNSVRIKLLCAKSDIDLPDLLQYAKEFDFIYFLIKEKKN